MVSGVLVRRMWRFGFRVLVFVSPSAPQEAWNLYSIQVYFGSALVWGECMV